MLIDNQSIVKTCSKIHILLSEILVSQTFWNQVIYNNYKLETILIISNKVVIILVVTISLKIWVIFLLKGKILSQTITLTMLKENRLNLQNMWIFTIKLHSTMRIIKALLRAISIWQIVKMVSTLHLSYLRIR